MDSEEGPKTEDSEVGAVRDSSERLNWRSNPTGDGTGLENQRAKALRVRSPPPPQIGSELLYSPNMAKEEIYFSTDVETDGPIPGPNSMLSLGSAAFKADGTMLSTFAVNLETLPGASGAPGTMEWWKGRPDAWKSCREATKAPEEAMRLFADWVLSLGGHPVFVGYPAGFDWTFCYWYLIRFTGESPFSFSAVDIKSFACALLGTKYRETSKRNMPKRWTEELPPHTHVAVDDAIEQGIMFCRMLKESRK